ncbi:hypothetical protein GGI20_003574 [Coemansia sp. BCRC 34301]|nr:hypothetical protein GGI20_003574 [Coemansia sp. BCRC 34301]
MAPGRPRRTRRPSSSSGQGPPLSGAPRQHLLRRRSSESSLPTFQGLPERMYQEYELLPDFDSLAEHPLLVDANSGRELGYRQFQSLAAVLATSMHQRHGVGVGDTVVIFSPPSIGTPVVSVATWLVGAGVIVIPPETSATELHHIVSGLSSPSMLFAAQAQLPVVAQMLNLVRASARQHLVIVATDGAEWAPSQPANVSLQDLYTARPDEAPYEREPLTRSGAQDHIAVFYSQFTRSDDGRSTDATPIPMSHSTVINQYNGLQRHAPLANRRPRRTPSLAYSVLRFHYAYQLHRIILDIFCKGGAYLVASSFDPAGFAMLVHRYQLQVVELASSEIRHLVEYLSTRDLNQGHALPYSQEPPSSHGLSIAEMLRPLHFIYSDTQEPEPVRRLGELLPHVELVRTRDGSCL